MDVVSTSLLKLMHGENTQVEGPDHTIAPVATRLAIYSAAHTVARLPQITRCPRFLPPS
jgi:hypothetical protein